MKYGQRILLAFMAALTLAACGDGGADTTPKSTASSVKIFGDSLMDSGTFGYRFTIQSANSNQPFTVFPERLADSFGFSKICAFFNGTTFTANPACSNFAVAGGRINNLTNSSAPSNAVPFSIPLQLTTASAGMTANDVVIIDGGANDLADIAGAYLGATTATSIATYVNALSTLLPAATVGAIVTATPDSTTLGTAGGAYAQALADSLFAAVNTNVIPKGVKRVLVINATDITVTPRFQAVLAGVNQTVSATAGAAAGAAAAANFRGLVQTWTKAFNAKLASNFSGTGVLIYDLYGESEKVFANPAQFGLRNITTPACPIVTNGVDTTTGQASLSLPATVLACNDASMSRTPPAGESGSNWWQSYAFSDNFHPSPALHQLIAQSISVQLAKAGWL